MRTRLTCQLSGLIILSIIGATAAEAAPNRGPPPKDPIALHLWCRKMVFDRGGRAAPQPGRPTRRVMNSRMVQSATSACVMSGGRIA